MLIPDNIDDFNSGGEKILYLRFKNDGSSNNMYVLHSLFTNHHLKNISGELDFLVLVPNEGFFAVEVKHGRVSRKDGTWSFTNRKGVTTNKKISPFAQVDGTINSIRSFVLKKIEHKKELHNRFSKILWGTGIAFTSMTELIDFGTEGHSWQILTKQGLSMPIGYYISALSKGWHNQNNGKFWYDVNMSRPTDNDCKNLLKIIRGDFDIDYSEINRINENEFLIEEYTKEQFDLLDFVNYNDRCLIEGSAGTGKTLMALEIAQRKIISNNKVGLFCFNKRLGDKLSKSIDEISPKKSNSFFAGTLHSYLAKYTDSFPPESEKGKQKYYSEELPFEFLTLNEDILESDKFDYLIIDEAQDLLSPNYIEVLDSILKGGIKNGRWIFFGDFSNQAIYLNNPQEIFRILNNKTIFTRFPPLRINCRNTKKIASQNTLLTGVNIPEFTSNEFDGNTVICKFPTINAQQRVIEDILQTLIEKEIPLDKITLLSPKRFDKSILSNSELILEYIKKGLQISTIQSFKGLENTIIILFDIDEISSEASQRILYVGISRARQELYIILNKSLENSYSTLIQNNFSKLR
ncbi:MAG TPA: NERD domain-containing protein/DEAD/DEAH box helicase [Prolixibacteraceae bacterium]|nr:NERD domain-containing protein/DEAD/DEAH box helicase [Prolixibacteraceae bacterium]